MESKPAWTVEHKSTHESTMNSAVTLEDIQSMASRRLLIDSFEWNIEEEVSRTIDPWSTFFANSRVVNRIANFKLLTSKMKIEVLLNGNQFYYGRMIVAYTPLPTKDTVSAAREGVDQDNIELSQKPHFYVDPTSSTGGEMVLPFLWPKNAAEITRTDLNRLGQLTLKTMSPLRHANGQTAGVTVSVYAEALDLSMDQFTSVNPFDISPQSGSADPSEMPEGPVSKPATAVAKMAGALTNVPIIGKYMRATQIAAGATAMVAKAFGYSKPRNLVESRRFNVDYNAGVPTTDAEISLPTLALTSKQECTIDPSTMAAPAQDEMAFSWLAQKEAYITKFQWRKSDPPQQELFRIKVTPFLYDVYQNLSALEYHMTPAAWVAAPFKYWRGSMEFRFQVVKSCFHKGRLRFVYDPNTQETAEYNVNSQVIMDVDINDEVTMRIGWGQSTNWLPVPTFNPLVLPHGLNTLPNITDNGEITVYVLNELTTPSDIDTDVDILVFPKMCEDFAVNVPTEDTIGTHSVNRDLTNAGSSWRDITIPGTLIPALSPPPTQSPRNDATVQVTDAAVNGVPDFNGTFQSEMRYWADHTGTSGVLISMNVGYSNSTNTTVAGSFTIGGDVQPLILNANSTVTNVDLDFVALLPGTSDAGANTTLLWEFNPGWITDDVMKVWINSYSLSVPPTIDTILIEPGSGLATGVGVGESALAKYDNGEPMEGWQFTSPSEQLVIDAPAGLAFLGDTYIVWLKPEGESDLSSSIGTITASPTGTGFDKIKLAQLEHSGSKSSIVIDGPGPPTILGAMLAFTEDITPQSGEADPCELPARPVSETTDVTLGAQTHLLDAASLMHFGEEPVSWRLCLKRFQSKRTIGTVGEVQIEYSFGVSPITSSVIFTDFPTLLDWVTPAYVCWRGSLRFRLDGQTSNALRDANNTFFTHNEYIGSEIYSTTINEQRPFRWLGSAVTKFSQPRMVELPWYSPYLFGYARGNPVPQPNNFNTDDHHRQLAIRTTVPNEVFSVLSVGTGEDFTLVNFLATPVVSPLS